MGCSVMCALWSRACELRVASRSPASHLLPHMWRTEICAVGGSWSRITLPSLVILLKNRRFYGSVGAGGAWGGGWGGLCSTDNRRSAAQWPAPASNNVWWTARKNLGPCWAVCATSPISLLRPVKVRFNLTFTLIGVSAPCTRHNMNVLIGTSDPCHTAFERLYTHSGVARWWSRLDSIMGEADIRWGCISIPAALPQISTPMRA
jgi:hypothetical protein